MKRIITLSIVYGSLALFANTVSAATFFWVPATGEYGLSKEIVADIKIDSEGVGVNAAQATIRFPKDILEVKSVDKSDSALSFWLEEPSFSNTEGAITFVGGTPYGVSGASIQVLHVVFVGKGSGIAPITFSDAAITASDGSGANILTKMNDASFAISPEKIAAPITPPKQIVREPTPAEGLPVRPTVRVPLYADPTAWHNVANVFAATWDLPRDITDVATIINRQPNFLPDESEGLFDNKMFQVLPDGVWYLHVRFKNDRGWGPTAHYRIAVDTKAPTSFTVTSSTPEQSDDPVPTLSFKSSDALSGLLQYAIRTDTSDWIAIPADKFKGTYTLQPQEPGEHHFTIRATDNAGNSIESTLPLTILPIPSPTITFVTDTIYTDEARGLSLKGTAPKAKTVLITLEKDKAIVAENTISVDSSENWEYLYSSALRSGSYIIHVRSQDARGAKSIVVDSPTIQVKGKYTVAIIITIVALLAILIASYLNYRNKREKTRLRLDVAGGDTAKVFNMIKTDVQKLQDAQHTPTTADDEFVADKLKKNVEKMEEYIQREIDRAKE